jgi:hypothetical protein
MLQLDGIEPNSCDDKRHNENHGCREKPIAIFQFRNVYFKFSGSHHFHKNKSVPSYQHM